MSTPELKPCPFCGEAPTIQNWGEFIRVECGSNSCALIVQTFQRPKLEAVNLWNTRQNPDESALNAAREPWQRLKRMYPNSSHIINIANEALAQISPQQSKTT